MLSPPRDLFKFRALLLLVSFHLRGRCVELRGITLFFLRAVPLVISVFEARLHEDL